MATLAATTITPFNGHQPTIDAPQDTDPLAFVIQNRLVTLAWPNPVKKRDLATMTKIDSGKSY